MDQRDIAQHYDLGIEQQRLARGASRLEFLRTQEIVQRHLPQPPAVVIDVGGGPGAYSLWLAKLGYQVHLVDLMPLHIEQAKAATAQQPAHPLASAKVGDARELAFDNETADAVLMLGPLYHLTERADRERAWSEARRVVKPGGIIFAAAISRFASALDGLTRGLIADSNFVAIVQRDMRDGQHRNPTNHPSYFTTAYFHRPEELREEAEAAGLQHIATLGVEGPAWILRDFDEQWNDLHRREVLLSIVRAMETEPSIIGLSAHILAIARKHG